MTAIDRLNAVANGLGMKAPVAVASTGNLTLSGEQTIDGVAVIGSTGSRAPDRVLVWKQTGSTANGIYDVASGTWSRSLDFDSSKDFRQGTRIPVAAGSAYGGMTFHLTSSGATVGTSAINFSQETVSGQTRGINTQVVSYTLTLTDAGKTVEMNKATTTAVTVPSSTSVNFSTGSYIDVVNIGAGKTRLSTGAGVTINTSSAARFLNQYRQARIYKRAANSWIAYGGLTTA